MFTGLVETVGRVARVERLPEGRRFRVETPFAPELTLGESVAVNGVCLTVTAFDADGFEAEAIAETLRKTTLSALDEGDAINLERALLPTQRLGGHVVLGHVDTTGEIVEIVDDGEAWRITVAYPPDFAPYLIPVGSVTVDGISLTVARLDEPVGTFAVAVIPHTRAVTTVLSWAAGRRVNLEFDVIGKYALRQQGLKER
ncbi:MAG: riboflavin synthase [Rhodothermales bacterium]|nr:riboflavin synthase [Rhodothermales bacterium]